MQAFVKIIFGTAALGFVQFIAAKLLTANLISNDITTGYLTGLIACLVMTIVQEIIGVLFELKKEEEN